IEVFFSSRRRHTILVSDWSSDVCSSDLPDSSSALQPSMPAVYYSTEAAKAGGLMSYQASLTDSNRQAGRYAGRILKGEKPADLRSEERRVGKECRCWGSPTEY